MKIISLKLGIHWKQVVEIDNLINNLNISLKQKNKQKIRFNGVSAESEEYSIFLLEKELQARKINYSYYRGGFFYQISYNDLGVTKLKVIKTYTGAIIFNDDYSKFDFSIKRS